MQDDDFSLFKSEIRNVKRISVDRADTDRPRSDHQQLKQRQLNVSVRSDEIYVDGLSDQFVIDVGPGDELSWACDGVQENQLHKLKQGLMPFDGSLDLHGMSTEKVWQTLWNFLTKTTHLEIHCMRVTRGKAAHENERSPLTKSHVDTWLRQHPQVLGFTSYLPCHDGTGSVYVMLHRTMLEGRGE